MNLARLLARVAALHPLAPAVLLGRSCLHDYATLARRTAALAGAMRRRLGLAPGARVALCMTNVPQYPEALLGAWWAGLAAVPINAKLHPKEVAFILEDSGAEALMVSADLAGALQSHLSAPAGVASAVAVVGVARRPSLRHVLVAGGADYERMAAGEPAPCAAAEATALAWLFYTSGTTGRPKGVMLTHRNLMTMTLCYFADVDVARHEDAALYAAPMSHGAGLYLLPNLLAGARHVVPESGGFDPAEILDLAAHHRDVSMFAAPTMVKRLVDHVEARGLDPGSPEVSGIKTVVYGGGPMYAADIRRAMAVMGPRFVQIYGQGESPMTITALSRAHLADVAHPRHEQRIASVGVAHSAVEVRVAAVDGAALPPGEIGEILVRGDSVMAGYWNDPDATARALRDGWLWTGDVGALDEDGFLTLKDRSKDLIISGGANVYPREVEEVLLGHPSVQEVAVVGRPHPEWGEEVVAFVVTKPGIALDPAALDALCLAHIARFKRPKAYFAIEALPKNNYGKVVKTELRDRLRA